MPENYLNPTVFTALFDDTQANAGQIAIGLQLIAQGVSRKFIFNSEDDHADAISDAVLHGIERISRFKTGRGTSAFSYFSSVAFNRIRRYCVRIQSDRLRRAASLHPRHHPAA